MPWHSVFRGTRSLPTSLCLSAARSKPTIDDFYQAICANSRIPLEEVKRYPHGHIFDSDVIVEPREEGCDDRLDCGNADMLRQLAEVFMQDYRALQDTPDYPFRYIPRRHNNFMNSSGRSIGKLNGGRPWNPVWMHPDDMSEIGVAEGGMVRIATAHDSITAMAEADATLRPGVVAIAHAFGGLVDEERAVPGTRRQHRASCARGHGFRPDHGYAEDGEYPRSHNASMTRQP